MTTIYRTITIVFFLLFSIVCSGNHFINENIPKAINKILPSVVRIYSYYDFSIVDQNNNLICKAIASINGSAIYYKKNDYIITNFHVLFPGNFGNISDFNLCLGDLQKKKRYTFNWSNLRHYAAWNKSSNNIGIDKISLIKCDSDLDLAIIKTKNVSPNSPQIIFNESYEPTNKVFTVGFPNISDEKGNFEKNIFYTFDNTKNAINGKSNSTEFLNNLIPTISSGIILNEKKLKIFATNVHDYIYILHTAPTSVGNSGGPLFNDEGKVIGINSYVNTYGLTYSVSLSSKEINKFLSNKNTNCEINTSGSYSFIFE